MSRTRIAFIDILAAGVLLSTEVNAIDFASGFTVSRDATGDILRVTAAAGTAGGGGPTISGGTNSRSTGTVNFSNSNGVSFGMNTDGLMTGSVETNYQAPGAYLTTAMASNRGSDFVNATAAFAGTSASGTIGSNGISVNIGPYITTAALSNHSHGVSFTSGSVGFQTLSFTNSNGISFNSGTQGIFASHNAITTARASTDAIGLNTAQSNVTWTVNSSGLSLDARGYAGTGTSATNASVTLNSNGLAISVASPGGGVTVSEFEPIYGTALLTNSTLGQNTLYFAPFDVQQYVSAYRVNFFHSIGTTLQASNSTNSAGLTFSAAMYSRGTGTATERISTFWSGSWFINMNNSSNSRVQVTHPFGISNSTAVSTTSNGTVSSSNASTYLVNSVGGYRMIPMPISLTLTPGRYWMAVAQSTNSSNAVGVIQQSVLLQTNGNNIAYRPFGTSSAASNASVFPTWPGDGTYSATSGAFPATVAMSNSDIRAGLTLTIPYFNFSGYTTGTNFL